MSRAAVFVAAMVLASAGADADTACGLGPGPATTIERPGLTLQYRFDPREPAVGQLFSVDIAVCDSDGKAPMARLKLDAVMPEHGHGMNTLAETSALGPGRFRADGLLFHMPGRWRLIFSLPSTESTERLISEIELR